VRSHPVMTVNVTLDVSSMNLMTTFEYWWFMPVAPDQAAGCSR
jgi:hypothetical protein